MIAPGLNYEAIRGHQIENHFVVKNSNWCLSPYLSSIESLTGMELKVKKAGRL